jgi:hypothetical protein
MKTKKFAKKLTLNKKTIANLGNEQLNQVKGGCASKPGETSCQTFTRIITCTCLLNCPDIPDPD